MENKDVMERILQNNKRGEELVRFIQNELPGLKAAAIQKHYQKKEMELQEKHVELKKELEYWQDKVIQLEVMNGIPQYALSSGTVTCSVPDNIVVQKTVSVEKDTTDSIADKKSIKADTQNADKKSVKADTQNADKKASKKEKEAKPAKEEKPVADDKPVDVSRLDLRIGRILNAKKHPDAESLYVEEIDVGESKPRTVVSGLVKYVPLEEMQNRLVVVLCNLKPAKMRGVTSEAMVMCASTPEKVEILVPPPECIPGDKVICNEYSGEPDSILPPKKKIFEQVAPDLKTNDTCVATYKSSPLEVKSKGEIKAVSLTNVQIK